MAITHTEYQLNDELRRSVSAIFDAFHDENLQQSLLNAGCVKSLRCIDKQLQVVLVYPYPCHSTFEATKQYLIRELISLDGIDTVSIDMSFRIEQLTPASNAIPNVKHIIAVASGKGGVGKSTTAVNLALALQKEGAKVGILDADIYGPSIPIMLGIVNFKPHQVGDKLMCGAWVHNIYAQSIGFIINPEEAAVWRGPMAAGALGQLINETQWPELDYLIIDMPPGTGDIQLTLSQKVAVSGAVIVTTPQDIALADAKKGISMFAKVSIPVLGIVENMSYHICTSCGHKEHPFGAEGGIRMAQQYHVPLLGQLPLNISIRESMDEGAPCVVSAPDSDITAMYCDMARKLGASVALQQVKSSISINISDDE